MKLDDDEETPQKMLYYCSRCRYKFRHNPHGETNLRCPYCGRTDKVSEY